MPADSIPGGHGEERERAGGRAGGPGGGWGPAGGRSGLTDKRGLEERLRAAEALVADGDDLAVGQLVALLQGGGGGGRGHLVLEVQGHVAQLLLDVAHDLALGCGRRGERGALSAGPGDPRAARLPARPGSPGRSAPVVTKE